jgi:hypothetical protein
MDYMGKNYQNELSDFLKTIQADLKNNRINKQQFDFLLGFFITQQINRLVKQEIDGMIPADSRGIRQMNFLSYKKKTNQMDYANR